MTGPMVTLQAPPGSYPGPYFGADGTAYPISATGLVTIPAAIITAALAAGYTITADANASQGVGTTVGATTATLAPIAIPPNSAATLSAIVTGYEAGTPAQASFSIFGGAVTGSGAPSLPTAASQVSCVDAALNGAAAAFVITGNDVAVQVTGVAGKTIVWRVTTYAAYAP